MQCKIFSVPLESKEALERERKLNDFLGATNVKRVFASLANQPEGPMWSVLFLYENGSQEMQDKQETQITHTIPATPEVAAPPGNPLTGAQIKSIVALKKWRADQAALEGVPLYMVAQNKWLEEIVQMPEKTLDDLKKVRGLGDWRVQKYGSRILEILTAANGARRAWAAPSYSAARA